MKIFSRKAKEPRNVRFSGSRPRGDVFSYYANRERSEEPLGRHNTALNSRLGQPAWLRNLPTYIAMIAIIVSTFYVTSLQAVPKVTHYVNPGEKQYLRDLETYRWYAQALLEESLLNRSKLTIDTQAITEEMRRQFPELASVNLMLPLFGRRPILEIDPSEPRLLLVSQSGAYVLDENGKAIINANDAPGLSAYSLPAVADQVGVDVNLGEGALPKDNVTFILTLLDYFNKESLKVESLSMPAVANEIHARFAGIPYSVKFYTEGDARQQTGTFFALKKKLEQEGISPAEYIDVRVEEKAYYR